jgi:hypothetical protein
MSVNNKYKVFFQGYSIHTISPELVLKQNINDEQLFSLKEIHIKKYLIAKQIEFSNKIKEQKELAKKFHIVEFELQRAYGYKEDAEFHKFWELPKCICPKKYNDNLIGKKGKIKDPHCHIH